MSWLVRRIGPLRIVGKKRHKNKDVQRTFYNSFGIAVNIDAVGKSLESKEGNADGQKNIPLRQLILQSHGNQQKVGALVDEIVIFEKSQACQTNAYLQNDQSPTYAPVLRPGHEKGE